MSLSTHVLDTALGRPAPGVALTLLEGAGEGWHEAGRGVTDDDGRCRTLLGEHALRRATYRLRFDVEPYFTALGLDSLYPFIEIAFSVRAPHEHFHIPLLLSANGYTTYRGS